LVVGLGKERLTVREAERLYTAWRKGDDEQRERMTEHPLLFLRAGAAMRVDDDEGSADELTAVVDDLGAVAGLCMRVRTRLGKHGVAPATDRQRRTLARAFGRAREAFGSLSATFEEEASECST
jgi:hypothetical protein